jgi:hypothetical protein
MSKGNKMVTASSVVNRLCRNLSYSRSHVAKVLRANADALGASQASGRWMMPESSVHTLRDLIVRTSGRRYKLGETGPHDRP